MISSSSIEVSSPKRCDNGAPFLGVTLELELLVVVTACPVPEPTSVLLPALDVRDSVAISVVEMVVHAVVCKNTHGHRHECLTCWSSVTTYVPMRD
jgi:hypothetical protein